MKEEIINDAIQYIKDNNLENIVNIIMLIVLILLFLLTILVMLDVCEIVDVSFSLICIIINITIGLSAAIYIIILISRMFNL